MARDSAPAPIALITGASSGFGLFTCIELAKAGARVFGSMRNLTRRGLLEQAARDAGVRIDIIELDVTSSQSVLAAVSHIEQSAGPISILVNNAGLGLAGYFEDTTEQELRTLFETNFFGAVAVTRAVLPGMRRNKRGRIINISSVNGFFGAPTLAAYSASKHALEGWSESLHYELAELGIFVSLVEPGPYKTEIFGKNRHFAAGTNDGNSPWASTKNVFLASADKVATRVHNNPTDVAKIIRTAATAKKPRLRYVAGLEAKLVAAAIRLLPARLFEKVIDQAVRKMFAPDDR